MFLPGKKISNKQALANPTIIIYQQMKISGILSSKGPGLHSFRVIWEELKFDLKYSVSLRCMRVGYNQFGYLSSLLMLLLTITNLFIQPLTLQHPLVQQITQLLCCLLFLPQSTSEGFLFLQIEG